MPLLSPDEILNLAVSRSNSFTEDYARWDILAAIYHGHYHKLYPQEFRSGEVPKVANLIRRTWDMFSRLVGKVPDKRVAPLSLSAKEQERADRLEKICFTYDNIWDMRRKMNIVAHYFVGMGAVAMGVLPDPVRQYPMLLVEDPRNVLPGPGWSATTISGGNEMFTAVGHQDINTPAGDLGGTLDDIIVRKSMTGQQLAQMFPGNAELMAFLADDKVDRIHAVHPVVQYYDAEWIISVLANAGITLAVARHNTGWCPWQFVTSFGVDAPAGTSMFEQQIGLEVAFMRLLDQKLGLADAVTWPWLAMKGFWDVDPAKRRMTASSPDADIDVISPPANFSVVQDMGMIRDLLRTMNFETEAAQGEITGGPITGRGVVELNRPMVETVQSFFDDLSFYLPKLYTTALVQDRRNFGSVTKTIAGRGRGETFLEDYTPAKHIGDRFGQVTTEFGPGLGGFEGHMQRLQLLGAEAVSLETVMEHDPNIRSVTDELRKIRKAKLEDMLFNQSLMGEAAVPPEWLAKLIDVIESGGDARKWIVENPPQQATATPENTGPVPPGSLPPDGSIPAPPGAAGPMIQPPPLEALLGGVA